MIQIRVATGKSKNIIDDSKKARSDLPGRTEIVLGVLSLGCVDYWKQIAVQGLAQFQLAVLELMEGRRHDTSAALEGDVIASPAKGDGAAPQL